MVIFVMGCISSKQDVCANVFQVINIDDYGNLLNSGQLEVTELEIIFYQRGKQAVHWPLRTLRRYGYDSERFTFEFGRRSPTGPGIYSFLCKRAEQLLFLLETKLQVRTHSVTDSEGNRQISHRLSSVSSSVGPLSPSQTSAPSIDCFPVAPIPRPLSQNIYANEEVFSLSTAQTLPNLSVFQSPKAKLSAARFARDHGPETNNNKVLENGSEHTYANSLLGGGLDYVPPGHLYMNTGPGTECESSEYPFLPPPPPYPSCEPNNYANLSLEQEPECRQKPLNYILLDLEPGGEQPPRSPTTSLPPESPKQPPGYATIDFDKTTALTHSVDPSLDDSKCSRKTRHNSNISDLPRHSSSVSD